MSQARLRIELLGHVRILHGGEPVITLASARRRALLAYLVLHRKETVDRERLAYLFWPDSDEGQARTNLRRELHHLRSELPDSDEVLDLGGATLAWRVGAPASTDVEAFEEARAGDAGRPAPWPATRRKGARRNAAGPTYARRRGRRKGGIRRTRARGSASPRARTP